MSAPEPPDNAQLRRSSLTKMALSTWQSRMLQRHLPSFLRTQTVVPVNLPVYFRRSLIIRAHHSSVSVLPKEESLVAYSSRNFWRRRFLVSLLRSQNTCYSRRKTLLPVHTHIPY